MRCVVLLFSLWALLSGAGAHSAPDLRLKATGLDTFDVILDPGGQGIVSAVFSLSFVPTIPGSFTPDKIHVRAPGWWLFDANEIDGKLYLVLATTDQPTVQPVTLLEYRAGTGCAKQNILLYDWTLTDTDGNEWGKGIVIEPPGLPSPYQVDLGCRLEFRNIPERAEAGRPLRPAPAVALVVPDAASYTGMVLLSVALSNPPGAAGWGTILVQPENGVAVFPTVHLSRPGSYVLKATAGPYVCYSLMFEVVSPPPYTMGDLARAAQVAAGFEGATAEDLYRLNAHWNPITTQHLDWLDVTHIARQIAGLDTSP